MKFQSQVTSGMIHLSPPGYDDSYIMIKGVAVGSAVQYIASDPPSKTLSRTGSYQSYPSPEMAITGRNCGIVEIVNGTYTIILKKPNSYYANGGTILLPPHVVLRIWDKDKWVGDGIATLDTMIPFKGLTYAPQRTGPEFYDGNKTLPVRTQQQILEDSAWCGEMSVKRFAEDFWSYVPRP